MTDTIYSLFQKTAAENRQKAAVIEDSGVTTFGELEQLAELIAGTFPDEVHSVGIVMDHRAEMIAAVF